MTRAALKRGEQHHWRILQDVGGTQLAVASGTCPDPGTAMCELVRYAVQYVEDGPIRCEVRTGGGPWKSAARAQEGGLASPR